MESEDVFVPPEDVGPVEKPAAAVGEAEAALRARSAMTKHSIG